MLTNITNISPEEAEETIQTVTGFFNELNLQTGSRAVIFILHRFHHFMQKEVVILRFYHDRKLKEIAAITGVSLPTAKSRLKQGLDKLRRYLDKEDFKA